MREYEILVEEARFSAQTGKHLRPARGVEGGGFGRPQEREAALIQRDLVEAFVTREGHEHRAAESR